jgi:hypothetical protein
MSAQLVLAWTAFETLASDLWEAAINKHLETLVSKAWEGKSVPFIFVRDNGLDLKNQMGTILKKHLKDPSFEEIVNQYQRTFSEGDAGAVQFWTHSRIRLPYSLRNLIVHRGLAKLTTSSVTNGHKAGESSSATTKAALHLMASCFAN